MNQLPPEMIKTILNNLNIQDKTKCRLINKKFKSIADNHIKVNELIFLRDFSRDSLSNWFYTNKPKRRDNLIIPSDYDFSLKSLFENSWVSRTIKKLKIKTELDIEKINKFNLLEELEIETCEGGQINLPYLKILKIFYNYDSKIDIELNTPNLSIFKCDNLPRRFNRINFVYPDKIKYVELREDYPVIKEFINLEYLLCYSISSFDTKPLLIKLKKLKEIHLLFTLRSIFQLAVINHYKEELKLENLKLFVCGLEFTIFMECRFSLPKHHEKFYILNLGLPIYSKSINILPFVHSIDYNDFLKVFKTHSQIPSDLFDKFPNISSVKCNGVIDSDNFLKFLKNLKNLASLKLDFKSLTDQHHYDKLPQSCLELRSFELKNVDESVKIDFNFILGFKYLNKLKLDIKLDKQFIKSLFTGLKYLRSLNFIYQGDYIWLSKVIKKKGFFELFFEASKYDNNRLEFNCLNDLFNFLEEGILDCLKPK